MKRLLFLCAAVALGAANVSAATKADSILSFTGASQAKFIWDRWPWANDDYTPKTQAQLDATGMQLMLLDTREPSERVLHAYGSKKFTNSGGAFPAYHGFCRISRSGKWVTWNDFADNVTYIVDATAASPTAKILLAKATCTFWAVRAMWADQATGAEYAYTLDDYKYDPSYDAGAIYKVPLNADGTANASGAVKIPYTGGTRIDDAIAVSADGKKIAGAFPWPNDAILDATTGALADRHTDGDFGCQANIAPDNSYRFFHCQGDHEGIWMYPANKDSCFFMNLNQKLPGVPASLSTATIDFEAPRWTNHLQYLTFTTPMGDNWELHGQYSQVGTTAAAVKALDITHVGSCILAKFAANFGSIEKAMAISQDVRSQNAGYSDGWICNGVTNTGMVGTCPATETTAPAALLESREPGMLVQHSGGLMLVNVTGNTLVSLTDAQGRLVRRWNATEAVTIDTKNLDAGVYVVSAANAGTRVTKLMTIPR